MSSSTKVLPVVAVERHDKFYSNCLKSFYNAGAFYFVSPGLYQWNSVKKEYFFKRSLPYQAFLYILQFWVIVTPFVAQYIVAQTGVCPENSRLKVFDAVIVASSILFWIFILFITFTSFQNHFQAFSDVLSTVSRIQDLLASAGVYPVNRKFIKTVFVGMLVFPPMISLTVRFLYFGKVSDKSIALFLHDQLCGIRIPSNNTKDTFMLGSRDPSLTLTPALNVLAAFILLAKHVGATTLWFSTFTAIMHAFIFYLLAKDFVRFLKQTQNGTTERFVNKADLVLHTFKELCVLSNTMEDAFGLVIACICFRTPLYFSVLSNYISAQHWDIIVELIMYSLTIGSFYFFSAEANSQLGNLSYWLQNTIEEFAKDEMKFKFNHLGLRVQLALNQLQTNQVGIRCRAFTITYGFVGGMAVLLLNYAILYYQLTT